MVEHLINQHDLHVEPTNQMTPILKEVVVSSHSGGQHTLTWPVVILQIFNEEMCWVLTIRPDDITLAFDFTIRWGVKILTT